MGLRSSFHDLRQSCFRCKPPKLFPEIKKRAFWRERGVTQNRGAKGSLGLTREKEDMFLFFYSFSVSSDTSMAFLLLCR